MTYFKYKKSLLVLATVILLATISLIPSATATPTIQILATTKIHAIRRKTLFYPVRSTIVSHYPLADVSLYFRVNNSHYTKYPMVNRGGPTFMVAIPGKRVTSKIDYYIEAVDILGQVVRDPATAPRHLYSFGVLRGNSRRSVVRRDHYNTYNKQATIYNRKINQALLEIPADAHLKQRDLIRRRLVASIHTPSGITAAKPIHVYTLSDEPLLNNIRHIAKSDFTKDRPISILANELLLEKGRLITRKKFTELIIAALGETVDLGASSSFRDLSPNSYIERAKNLGIIDGRGRIFLPDQTLSRQLALSMILRALQTRYPADHISFDRWYRSLPIDIKHKLSSYVADITPRPFYQQLQFGQVHPGSTIIRLKKVLSRLGYFRGKLTPFYDTQVELAIYRLQREFGIVQNLRNVNAGRFNQETRKTLNRLIARELSQKTMSIQHPFNNITQYEALTLIDKLLFN